MAQLPEKAVFPGGVISGMQEEDEEDGRLRATLPPRGREDVGHCCVPFAFQ